MPAPLDLTGIPSPGTLVAGKYRIERVLGAGGMGVVLCAEHEALGERVALKYLLPELADNQEFVARFQREARAAAKVRGAHVARVLDVDRDANQVPFIVMELLQGHELRRLLERGALLPHDAVGYVLQACEALAEAHALGIVHRDLKPDNLFLHETADGSLQIKVMDFGIAKFSGGGAESLSLTRTSTGVMGSPLYMAPEQMRVNRNLDARVDLWSLGVILFELLVGSPPFVSDSIQELVAMIVQDDPPRLRSLSPQMPQGLDDLLHRALQKRPDDRFQTITEFASALAQFGDADAPAAAERVARIYARRARSTLPAVPEASTTERDLQPPPHLAAVDPQPTLSRAALSVSRPEMGEHSRRALILGGSAAAAVVVALGLWWVAGATSESEPRTGSSPPATSHELAAYPQPMPVPVASVPAATSSQALEPSTEPTTDTPPPVASAPPSSRAPRPVAKPRAPAVKPVPAPSRAGTRHD